MATSRNFSNVAASTTPEKMASNYTNMLNAISNMLSKEGPVYSTWIRFQIGKSNSITFDSTSNDKKQNMIADLTFDKKGVGVVNSFELRINYDPFDYGQNTTDKIELLDELIAEAMSYDMDSDEDRLRGYLQYGYNCPTDTTLISPKYQFILTNAQSSVDWSTGIAQYTFEGTTELAADSNYTTSFPQFKNVNLIDLATTVLWAYYGKESNKPTHSVEGIDYSSNKFGYMIQVDDNLRNNAPVIDVPSVSNQSPWIYIKDLLNTHMSKTDDELAVYKNDAITQDQKPRYNLFITDEAAAQAIHIQYICPKDSSASTNISIDYNFTWGRQSQTNLVIKWNPDINLKLYLLQQASKSRAKVLNDKNGEGASDEFLKYMNESYLQNAEVFEMYDATLTLVGIPADLPLCAEVTIMPRILESVSRTAGIYMIKGGTDRITTKGEFSSELKLIRIRSLNEPPVSKVKVETTNKNTNSIYSKSTNDNETTIKQIAEDFNSKSTTSKAIVSNGEIKITQGVWTNVPQNPPSSTYTRVVGPSAVQSLNKSQIKLVQ